MKRYATKKERGLNFDSWYYNGVFKSHYTTKAKACKLAKKYMLRNKESHIMLSDEVIIHGALEVPQCQSMEGSCGKWTKDQASQITWWLTAGGWRSKDGPAYSRWLMNKETEGRRKGFIRAKQIRKAEKGQGFCPLYPYFSEIKMLTQLTCKSCESSHINLRS